ncbi:epidermal growth factor receptor kinase substrate 8-like protein 3 [Patagioenas fasciata]|uniref:epidermal growth factor receptor kinase substrate 8-like protein 3 n=1 Tax=Patagioenas fasciata TaxID=372321 RepID=UPI0032E89545
MGDPFGRWSSPLARSEYDDSSALRHPNNFSRPSGKSIYNQRKDYIQNLLKPQSDFQHHVEHLLTLRLERDLRSAEDCLARLKLLDAQGKIWGQNVILHVRDQDLVLRDVESKEELDVYPLGSIQGCSAALDTCSYDSVLSISVQERSPPGSSVLLFQCEQPGAEVLRSSLEKVLKQRKEEQRGHYGHRPQSSLDTPLSLPPPSYTAPERWAETPTPDFSAPPQRGLPPSDYSESRGGGCVPQFPPKWERGEGEQSWDPLLSPGFPDTLMSRTIPKGQVIPEVDRDVEILNHVLDELDLFVSRLKAVLDLANTNVKKKKKKKNKDLPPQGDYVDFFQKVKYTLNLMGRTYQHVSEPTPPELLHLIFTALSFVLAHSPSPSLAREVEAPLLEPGAVELLERTLHPEHYGTWKTLGPAWNRSRAEYPNGEGVPPYTPVFSDGWLPPPVQQVQHTEGDRMPQFPQLPLDSHSAPPQSPATSWRDNPDQVTPFPAQEMVRAMYEFQARNSQELSVRMGDTLQVLDPQKKWWLVQDGRGDKGYVPSNILEPLGHGAGGHSNSQLQESPPNLHPDSSPAEVTAWLKDKGFQRITVRCLGVLTGQQLLQMSPEELRAVCPEEWRRVLFKLSPIRTSLGMSPRD